MKKSLYTLVLSLAVTCAFAQKTFKKIPFSGTQNFYSSPGNTGSESTLYKGEIEITPTDINIVCTTDNKVKHYKILDTKEEKTTVYDGGISVKQLQFKTTNVEDGLNYYVFILRQITSKKDKAMNVTVQFDDKNKMVYGTKYMDELYNN